MKKYIHSIFVLSVIISIPFIFFITIGLTKTDFKVIAIYTGIMMAYWGIYWQLKRGVKYFFWISFIPVVTLWLILFIQEISRVVFIFKNGGMERADGMGSPLAFLIGMSFELIFFIPLSYVLVRGILYLVNTDEQ